MNRITISLPDYIYDSLTSYVSKGKISSFIADSIDNTLTKLKIEKEVDPIDEFLSLRKKLNLPRKTSSQIKKAIEKGRA